MDAAWKTGAADVLVRDATIRVAFAQYDVMDKDGDVFAPGSMPVGRVVPISSYGHGSSLGKFYLPVGKGRITTDGRWAILEGRLFAGTAAGRDHLEVIRELGPAQEWSFYFRPTVEPAKIAGAGWRFARVNVFEVSPVLEGSGRDTHTIEVAPRSKSLREIEQDNLAAMHRESVQAEARRLGVRA